MRCIGITKTSGWQATASTFMARIKGNDAANITQASISSIACAVFRKGGTEDEPAYTSVAAPTVTKADSVFDTLQTDSRWDSDGLGYNFRHTIDGTAFPEGDAVYRIEYTFTPTSGQPLRVVFEHFARDLAVETD